MFLDMKQMCKSNLWPSKHRVLSEVDLVLGGKSYVEYEDLQKLEYTEQVSLSQCCHG